MAELNFLEYTCILEIKGLQAKTEKSIRESEIPEKGGIVKNISIFSLILSLSGVFAAVEDN